MGITRNGARTFLNVLQKACKLSHLPGFQNGMRVILGTDAATGILELWNPLCVLVEQIISLDDWFNKKDATLPDQAGSEDAPFG